MITNNDRDKYIACKEWVRRGLGTPDQLERYRSFIASYEAQTVDSPAQHTLFDQVHQADPEPILPQPEDTQPERRQTEDTQTVKIHAQLALAAGRGNHPGALQVWYLARNFVKDGSGIISRADLFATLRALGVDERRRRRWLVDAKAVGLICEVRGGSAYRLTSLARVAELYGVADDIGATALVSAVDWAGKHWRSIAWGAFLESFGRLETITNKDGIKEKVKIYYPVSRAVLADISGVPEQTQRDLERHIPVIKRKNYKITDTPADHIESYKRLEGVTHAIPRRVTGAGAFVAVRLPDRRRLKPGTVTVLGFGRSVAIREDKQSGRGHACKNIENPGSDSGVVDGLQSERLQAVGATGGKVRLFYRDADKLSKRARKMGLAGVTHITELFRKIPGKDSIGRYYRCGWWAVEPLLTPLHP